MPTYTTAASGDDAHERISDTAVTITAQGTETAWPWTRIDGAHRAAYRFQNVTIAQGATISSATFQFDQLNNYSGGGLVSGVTIYGEKATNSATYSATSGNISARARTTANTTSIPDTAASGKSQLLTVTSIVQEIISQAGWVSGNALSIHFMGSGTAGNFIQPYDYDYSGGFYKASLVITTGTVATAPRSTMLMMGV